MVRERVEAAFLANKAQMRPVNPALVAEIEAAFAPPAFEAADARMPPLLGAGLRAWVDTNVAPHKLDHYAIVTVSLKPIGGTPGDATAEQMRVVADLAESLRPRRDPGQPRAEPDPAARAAPAPARGLRRG